MRIRTRTLCSTGIYESADGLIHKAIQPSQSVIIYCYSAREKYNKICIQQLNLRGNISNVYLEWSGSYVSPSPYDNWNPSFRPGDYGIVPSTHEEGFYYSANDTPIAYNAVNTPLVSIGDGWEWQKNGNHGYTEKIIKNWFWFEAYF